MAGAQPTDSKPVNIRSVQVFGKKVPLIFNQYEDVLSLKELF